MIVCTSMYGTHTHIIFVVGSMSYNTHRERERDTIHNRNVLDKFRITNNNYYTSFLNDNFFPPWRPPKWTVDTSIYQPFEPMFGFIAINKFILFNAFFFTSVSEWEWEMNATITAENHRERSCASVKSG